MPLNVPASAGSRPASFARTDSRTARRRRRGGRRGSRRGCASASSTSASASVAVVTEERAEPVVLGGVEVGPEAHLALEHPERIDRDAVWNAPVLPPRASRPARGTRGSPRAAPRRVGRSCVVRHPSLRRARSRRSHSVSPIRRPSVASSTERTRRSRCVKRLHLADHAPLQRAHRLPVAERGAGRPRRRRRPGTPRAGRRRFRTRRRRRSTSPKRHDFTHNQPRSSTGSPRCASSQSSTARIPSGPTMKLPLRKSPCTSAGAAGSGGRGRRASAARARTRDGARRSRRADPRYWATWSRAPCTGIVGQRRGSTAWIRAAISPPARRAMGGRRRTRRPAGSCGGWSRPRSGPSRSRRRSRRPARAGTGHPAPGRRRDAPPPGARTRPSVPTVIDPGIATEHQADRSRRRSRRRTTTSPSTRRPRAGGAPRS